MEETEVKKVIKYQRFCVISTRITITINAYLSPFSSLFSPSYLRHINQPL